MVVTHIYTCRGPAARTPLERALALKALEEVSRGLNLDAWKWRILAIYQIKQLDNPHRRYGGNINGRYYTIPEMIEEWGQQGIERAWHWYKNERAGCGYQLDGIIRQLEYIYPNGRETYRRCPRCGDLDPITIGRTKWPLQ